MTIGSVDLSIVTDRIIDELKAADDLSQLHRPSTEKYTLNVTGLSPSEAHEATDIQLSVYLFHVTPDAFNRNTYTIGEDKPRVVPEQPLGLTLRYLLSVHNTDFIKGQRIMGSALQCLHEHCFMTAPVPGNPPGNERFTVTMEPQTVDEIGRLWLAMATPLGLSAVYRVEVVFLPAKDVERTPAKRVATRHVTAAAGWIDAPLAVAMVSAKEAQLTGDGFDPATIELWVDGATFAVLPTMAAPSAVVLADREALVVSRSEIHLRLPAGTSHGRHVLEVRTEPGSARRSAILDIEADVP